MEIYRNSKNWNQKILKIYEKRTSEQNFVVKTIE